MRRKWLLVGIALLTAIFAVGAIACGGDDNGDDGDGDGDEDGDGDGLVLQLIVDLAEVDGSGATGVADLSVNGEGILVSLVMEGLPEGAHANHIHKGACDDQGEIDVTLDQIVADELGDGIQTTANNENPLSHYAKGHYLAVHEGDDESIGAVISCGNVVEP